MSPYRHDLPGTGDPYGTAGGLSGLEDLLATPPQPKPYYRPYERQSLGNLIEALRSGLDPSTAFQMLSGIQGEAGQRHDQQQQMRQQTMGQASDALLQLAQTNPDPAAAETYLGAYGTLHPNMGEQATSRLDELVGQLYPGGGTSPLMPPPEPGAGTLDDADFKQIDQEIADGVAQGATLHDVRMPIMSKLRIVGATPEEQAQVFDYIGRSFAQVGGVIGSGTTITRQPLSGALHVGTQ